MIFSDDRIFSRIQYSFLRLRLFCLNPRIHLSVFPVFCRNTSFPSNHKINFVDSLRKVTIKDKSLGLLSFTNSSEKNSALKLSLNFLSIQIYERDLKVMLFAWLTIWLTLFIHTYNLLHVVW